MRGKIDELESLRGVAALTVVLCHFPTWNQAFHDPAFVKNAAWMVEFFFVLSGFVIALNYRDKIHTLSDAARFQFLRLGRLYPVHLLFVGAFVGFEIIKALAIPDAVSPAFSAGETGPRELLENLLLIHGLGFSASSTYNVPSWTISTEFYVYAIFALLLLVAPSWKNTSFAAMTTLSGAALVVVPTQIGPFSQPLLCICGFFAGCLVAEVSQRLTAANIVLPAVLAPASVLALIVYLSVDTRTSLWEIALVFPLSAVIVLSVANGHDGQLKKVLRLTPIVWLGTISYSLYMAHYPVIYAADVFMRRVLSLPTIQSYGQPVMQLTTAETALAYVAVYSLIIMVSAVSFYFVEKPFRDWSRKLVSYLCLSTKVCIAK